MSLSCRSVSMGTIGVSAISAVAYSVYQYGGALVQSVMTSLTENVARGISGGLSNSVPDIAEKGAIITSAAIVRYMQGISPGAIKELAQGLSKNAESFSHFLDLQRLLHNIGKNDIGPAMEAFAGDMIYSTGKIIDMAAKTIGVRSLGYYLGWTIASSGTYFVLWYLFEIFKHRIGRPSLANEINQRDIFTPVSEAVRSYFKSNQRKPIFNSAIMQRVVDLTAAIENIRKHGGIFPNVCFYGPGGTGKTMISQYMTEHSGMSYMKMSGGDLAQYIKRGEHVSELNKLMDKATGSWRPWSTRPWILFIDEAESLCKDRSKLPSAELLELQNAFLNRTGVPSQKFMIILSTNRIEDIDEAILSRMDYKIYIGPPAEPERLQILKDCVNQLFSPKEVAECFNSAIFMKIAQITDGLTGRDLFKIVNALHSKKASTKDNKLSAMMIESLVREFVKQEKEIVHIRQEKEKNHQPIATTSIATASR